MSKANYALRLQPSLKAAAERLAALEGTSLNHFINVAVAEKLSALETEQFFRDRANAANRADFLGFLDGSGDGPPIDGDRLEPAERA
jgi:uncharacterized protein (DUF1778 family)